MRTDTDTQTVVPEHNGAGPLSHADVARLFEDGYREVEILPDGTIREAPRNGDQRDEAVTRTLKTERTWY